ncbi:MAG: hypothetical protein HY807_10780 [Nitrospirae bacterium]|nr:hypothetical protein [Nitrospirota bacterium]
MKKLRSAGLFLMVMMAVIFLASPDVFSKPLTNADNPWQGKARPGFMVGDGEVENDYFIDLLMPMWGNNNALFFFNPHFRYDDNDGNEENLGLGYRRFIMDGKAIVGGNLFWDSMRSENNFRYEQIGLGLEAMSDIVDLRANIYYPYGTTKERLNSIDKYEFGNTGLLVHEGYEEAMSGADAEVGVLVPVISDTVETRVFGGGYWYDSSMVDSVKGWKVRAEIRPMQILNINIEVKDDDIRSATFIGGYLDLPFSFGDMLAGENPFKGASKLTGFGTGTRSLKERMTDKVVRDRHIVAVAQPDEDTKRVLDENGEPIEMIYVNSDNDAAGNGTYANPYQDIADAPGDVRYLDGAWVYVFCDDNEAGCTQNDVSIELMDNMVLWGQGYRHAVYGIGGGVHPILDGIGSGGPVVTLADNNEVMGLTLQNGTKGILGYDIQNTNIHHNNIINNNGDDSGIHIENEFNDVSGMHLTYRFDNNVITDNYGDGLYLYNGLYNDFAGTLDDVSITTILTNNTFGETDDGNSDNGAYIYNEIYTNGTGDAPITNANITVTASDNTATDNSDDGVYVDSEIWTDDFNSPITNASIEHTFTGNSFYNNQNGADINAYIYSYGQESPIYGSDIISTFTNTTASGNGEDGVYDYNEIWTSGQTSEVVDSSITTSFTDNASSFDDNGESGIDIESWIGTDGYNSPVYSDIEGGEVFIRNTVTNNSVSGNGLDAPSAGDYDGIEVESWIGTENSYSDVNDAYIYNTIENNMVDDSVSNNGIWSGSNIYAEGYSSDLTNVGVTSYYTDNTSTNSYGENFDIETDIYTENGTIDTADIDNNINGNTATGSNDNDGIEVLSYIYTGNTCGGNCDINDANIDNYFSNNTSSGNSNDGIWNESEIYTESSLSGITDASITNTYENNDETISWNEDHGINGFNTIYTTGYSSDISNGDITNTFNNNEIADNNLDGVYLDNEIHTQATYSRISDSDILNEFEGNTIGNLDSGNQNNGVRIYENFIYTTYDDADVTNSTIYNTFTDNTIQDNNGYGIYLGNSGNYIATYAMGSEITGAELSNSFIGNDISSNDDTGVYLGEQFIYDAYGSIDDASITNYFEDNTISDNNGDGVYSYQNYIETNTNGAYINNAHIYNTFQDNTDTISGNNGSAIYFNENYIYTDYDFTPISLSSIENTVTNNTITGNNGDGAYFYNWIANDDDDDSPISDTNIINLFEDNVMTGNNGDGIYLENYIYTDYEDSSLDNDSIQNTFTNNTLTGTSSDQYGIYVYSEFATDDTDSEILNSDITDSFTDNVVTNFYTGIWAGSNLYDYEDTYGIVTSLFFQGNVVADNRDDGLVLGYDISDNPWTGGVDAEYDDWYLAHFTFDLGNGELDSLGNNSFYGNTGVALFHNVSNPWSGWLPAQNNYWGSATPDFPSLIGGTYLEDYTSTFPYFETDPNPIP